ncbi:MAG TPA: pyrroline-5-carboxylate reductase [Acidimicrobiales bacterium]|nr:pyrroline-5-carboxylate reductase [Acidimicrobiales bacterium]
MAGPRPRLLIVGGGRMGEALLGGLLATEWARAEELAVSEKLPGRRAALSERYPGVAAGPAPVAADGAVLAVKPDDAEVACREVAEAGAERLLSIVTGVPIQRLEGWLGGAAAVVRAVPNTPALVGAGATAIAAGRRAGETDMGWAEHVLGSVGRVVRVPEHLLDAVTGLSGSGPGYVYLLVEALIEAGVLNGLTWDLSRDLVVQTVLGSARLLLETGERPESLRSAVVSPGGTTAAGLAVLESRAVRGAVLEAVAAATDRARQLGLR